MKRNKEKAKSNYYRSVWVWRFLFLFLLVFCAPDLFSQTTEHVILVIIDGARYSETLGDPQAQWTPKIHQLAQQGVVVDTFLNDGITVTKSAIPAIWCGSWSVPKDTVVNGIANQYATVPTVWEYFRKSRGVDSTQAMYIMKNLSSPWIQSYYPEYGPQYWPWYILQGSSDLDVWQNARAKLLAYHPTLAVLYLADVDSYGHSGIWANYTHAIQIADSIVGMLWDFVQSDVIFQNKTTLLITNDHGRHLDGISTGFVGHGDGCWGCRHIMLLGIGAGIPQSIHTSARHTISDIAPTIGALLQFPTPYASGKPMLDVLTSIERTFAEKNLPASFRLEQNYPNPFNPTTVISYQLPVTSFVKLAIYDLLGREVKVLVNEVKPAGIHTIRWNAAHMPSGIYFYRLNAGAFIQTRQSVLIK